MLRRRADGSSEVLQHVCDAAVCIGGGPSLTFEQCELVRKWRAAAARRRVIAINDAYLRAPWADLCYFADAQWHAWHSAGVARPALNLTAEEVRERFAAFAGAKCSTSIQIKRIRDAAVHSLQARFDVTWSDDPRTVARGSHGVGGLQGANVATLAGARTVYLIGYDAREPEPDEAPHWFGDHPTPTPLEVYRAQRRSFDDVTAAIAARGVKVVNCSPGSAIGAFERADLEDALAESALSVA
jgi:hypothetical protein